MDGQNRTALKRILNQIINLRSFLQAFPRYINFLKDLRKYSKMSGAEEIKFRNIYPIIYEKTKIQSHDPHYFFQDIWLFKRILESKCEYHIDVGSKHAVIGLLSTITKVTYIELRPLKVNLENFESKKGNILSLPYENNSIKSLSSCHVAEHIGLGRYGDKLDPFGTKKAAKELTRVLAPEGNLYFSLPIGKPRLCFNGHRIHSTEQILRYFDGLELIELSGTDDKGKFIENVDRNVLDQCLYGCGYFWFKKRKKTK